MKKPSLLSNCRFLFLWGAIVSLGLLGSAYALEYGYDLEPCSLCYLQRYLLWALCFMFWVGAIFNHRNLCQYFYCPTSLIICLLGMALSIRQLWLQYFTAGETSNCTAGFEKMLEFQPFFTALKETVMNGDGCGAIDFTLFALPLSAWSLLSFTVFFIYTVIILRWITKRRV